MKAGRRAGAGPRQPVSYRNRPTETAAAPKDPPRPTGDSLEASAAFRQAITMVWHLARRNLTSRQPRMTMARLEVLRFLAELGPMSPGELAAHTGTRPSSLTRVIAGLEDRDLLARYVDRRDRRSHIIEITDAGRAEFEQARMVLDRAFARGFEQLSPQERSHLIAAIPLVEKVAASFADPSEGVEGRGA